MALECPQPQPRQEAPAGYIEEFLLYLPRQDARLGSQGVAPVGASASGKAGAYRGCERAPAASQRSRNAPQGDLPPLKNDASVPGSFRSSNGSPTMLVIEVWRAWCWRPWLRCRFFPESKGFWAGWDSSFSLLARVSLLASKGVERSHT